MAQPGEGKGQIALGGRQTGPVAGCILFAHDAIADIATADVGKHPGDGLRCGTYGKPFPCTVCGLRGQKLQKHELLANLPQNAFCHKRLF